MSNEARIISRLLGLFFVGLLILSGCESERDVASSSPTDAPTATSAVEPTTVPIPTVAPIEIESGFKVNQGANLRGGPGTDYPVVGGAAVNEAVEVTGKLADGSWYQLASGAWIAARLVDGDSGGIGVVDAPPPPAPATVAPAAIAPVPTVAPVAPAAEPAANINPNAFTCVDGCSVAPDPSCAIKGNVNSKKEKIYHAPGYRDYNRTNVKPEEGDRWFCTIAEAEAAGFRAPQNH